MEKLSLNEWIHFLAIFFLFEIIVCRGIYFIVAYACHLSFRNEDFTSWVGVLSMDV
jgi:hypothetical protein